MGFADEEVDVLGHDHVSDDRELIALAHLFEHGEKQVATLRCAEQGMASIATAGNKMQVSGAVKTLGLAVHMSRIEPRSSGCGDATHHPTVMKAGSGENPLLERREKGGTPGVSSQP